MNQRPRLLAASVAICFLTVAPSALATPVSIAPHGTVTAFTPTTSTFTGTEVGSFSMTFSNAAEQGTVYENVYQSGNTFDFYYQVANDAASTDSLYRLTVGNFTGFSTSVDYLLNGGDAPTSANRQTSGDSIGFNIEIDPGTISDWIEVATNATNYGPTGTIALQDSIATNFSNSLDPALGVAPEPSTYAMLFGGLALLGFCLRRKSALL
jgi:hypothetical protein